MMQTQNVPAVRSADRKLVAKFADKFNIEPDKLLSTLKQTCFRVKDAEVTNEQMAALLVVADQYGLNPFTREIYAFPDKGGIVPVVGVDGWARIINEHPAMDGFEFKSPAESICIDEDAKPCPEWMEVVIHRKDRTHPVIVREHLDECYKPVGKYKDGNKKQPGPWQTHTKRFLRHKTLIQGARIAFGFAGVYDEDEAERITSARVIDMSSGMPAAIDISIVPPNTAEFDRLATAAGVASDPEFAAFLPECAKANGISVEDLKQGASKDFDNLLTLFRQWTASRAQQSPARTVNRPTREEMQAKRESAKSELEGMGVFEAVAKAMSDKGQGRWDSWNSAQCQRSLEIGKELVAQADDQPPAIPTVLCPARGNQAVAEDECEGCQDAQAYGCEIK